MNPPLVKKRDAVRPALKCYAGDVLCVFHNATMIVTERL